MVGVFVIGSLICGTPQQAEGFPAASGGKSRSAAISIADLDGDGLPEIITLAENSVVVLGGVGEAAGKIRDGFPASYVGASTNSEVSVVHAPIVCDIDGDGQVDLGLVTTQRKVWAWTAAGELLPSYPVTLADQTAGPIACGGKGSMVLLSKGGALVRIQDGVVRKLATVGSGGNTSGIAMADMNGDGRLDMVLVGGDARLRIFNSDGSEQPLAAYRSRFRASGVPGIGDINDDGSPDVIFGSEDFHIHAVSNKGVALPGFPVKTGYRVYAGAALGDLDNDGVSDVVVASGDGKLYAVDGEGKPLKGFPVKLAERLWVDPVIGDIDRDGRLEVVVVSADAKLHVLNWQGKPLAGFPQQLPGKGRSAAALADVDGDGNLEIIAQGTVGLVHAFQVKSADKVKHALAPWPMSGHDAGLGGRFSPNPGRFKKLGHKLAKPFTTDNLALSYRYFDLDGDAEAATRILWYRDGKSVVQLGDQRVVPAKWTTKNEVWHYTLQTAENFSRFGVTGPLARVSQSTPVRVQNSAPLAPKIELGPTTPRTTTPLHVTVVEQAADLDADPVNYGYVWLRDGVPVAELGPTVATVPASMIHKGEAWRVIVVPNDGQSDGEPASHLLEIHNSAPTRPTIALAPNTGKATRPGGIAIALLKPSTDDDGDSIHYRYRYWLDERAVSLRRDSGTVGANVLRKGQTLRVEVTPLDSQSAGPSARLEVKVANHPPAAPTVALWPPEPRTTDALSFRIVKQTPDADADAIRYRHRWLLNGKPTDVQGAVPAQDTRKGQRWQVEVVALDGEAESPVAGADTTVLNHRPAPPTFVLPQYTLATDAEIKPQVQDPSSDVDEGDVERLHYLYRWYKNGSLQSLPLTTASLDPALTRKGERWQVSITASDASEESLATTINFVIRNTPPTPPRLSVAATHLTVRQTMQVAIAAPSTDIDGDTLRYHYSWFKRGKKLAFAPSKNTLLPGEARKGDRLRVEVRADDGDGGTSAPAVAELWIDNHQPSAPTVTLLPSNPTAADEMHCQVDPLSDPDIADKKRLRAQVVWLRDAKPVQLPPTMMKVPPGLAQRGESWACEVRTSDGETHSSATRTAAVVVANAAPQGAVVQIGPRRPKTSDDLVCELASPATDVDGDNIEYVYEWRRDGKAVSQTDVKEPHVIRAKNTRSGQNWACAVVAKDATRSSSPVRAVAVVHNSDPTAPRVAISPEQPEAGKPISCTMEKTADDADRDRLQYKYIWYKNGVQQTFAPTSTKVPGRLIRAKQKWRCSAVANDGTSDGATGQSALVSVATGRD